jgi:hypothetical protein
MGIENIKTSPPLATQIASFRANRKIAVKGTIGVKLLGRVVKGRVRLESFNVKQYAKTWAYEFMKIPQKFNVKRLILRFKRTSLDFSVLRLRQTSNRNQSV